MIDREYDVVVVGAGPAGAAAAFHLATQGVHTLLVDRCSFPRAKVCGDGLTPRALYALDQMGLGDVTGAANAIQGLRVVIEGRSRYVPYASRSGKFQEGAVVPRLVLDDRLVRSAVASGAEFADQVRVTDLHRDKCERVRGVLAATASGSRRIRARHTVLADGGMGRISDRFRRRSPRPSIDGAVAVRCYLGSIEGLEPWFEVHEPIRWRGRRLVGYGWIFPLPGNLANVGLGFSEDGSSGMVVSARAALRDFLADLMARDRRFRRAHVVGPIEGGFLRTRMEDPSRAAPGVLMIGDAAGLVYPFTGEGIAYALESGEIAASVVKRALVGGPSAARAYGARLQKSYPRHAALRGSRHHLRWLSQNALLNGADPTGNPIVRAFLDVALDEPIVAPAIAHSVNQGQPGMIDDLIARFASSIGDRMRRVDALLAEATVRFVDSDPRGMLPTIVAAAVGGVSAVRSVRVRRALLGITLLEYAHLALAEVGRETDDSHEGSAAGVVVGDCLLTEALAVLASLPDGLFRSVSQQALRACRARGEASHAEPDSLAEHYEALAGGAVAAAGVVGSLLRWPVEDVQESLSGGHWFAAMRLALWALERHPHVALRRHVTDCLGMTPVMRQNRWPYFTRMVDELRAEAGTILARDRLRLVSSLR